MGIELVKTPSYSPDLNPVEFGISKVKEYLNGYLSDLDSTNIHLAAMEATKNITVQDMKGFYKATSYSFVYETVKVGKFSATNTLKFSFDILV